MSDNESKNKPGSSGSGGGNPAKDGGPGTTNIYKVSVKYAAFNRDDPEIWFTQLEAQFQLAGVTVDGTKYGHLIAALDNETIKCVRDKVLNPPDHEKYNSLKTAIINRLCDSAKIKLNKLLSGLQLGDKKPSQLLREMQVLSINQITDAVLQTLWLQRLPTQVQEILSGMEDLNLERLSIAADKIVEVQRPIEISSVSHVVHNQKVSNESKELKSSIDALSKRIESLFDSRSRSHSKNQSHSQGRDNNRSKSRSEKQTQKFSKCWYHYKFGEKAQKCNKPCSFNTNRSHSKND